MLENMEENKRSYYITNNTSDHFDEKYMKIKFSSGDDLLLKKVLKLHDIIIVFLDPRLYKISWVRYKC